MALGTRLALPIRRVPGWLRSETSLTGATTGVHLASADVRAQERAEVNGGVAVAEDLVAVPLVNVEIPAARRDRLCDVGEDPHGVHDLAAAVGQQVLQHVLDRSLAHAAAQVDVRGLQP